MIKTFAVAAALVVLPATVFAQSTGPAVRDPAGGATRDPALSTTMPGTVDNRPMKRDPAGGSMIDDSPRFRTYVMEQRVPSYRYEQPVIVGIVLPEQGVVYREVPAGYGAQGYRYTVINDRAVVIEPGTRRIVQIID
ncbi:DUF1236 domain-containing protein [Bosea sp. (in: a-proteobacteria)]|jgi:hypothetical protein|uniref:DUF1236 domain-containing protein n=1 Tax=Bosea sp. (in: a-proteobacteria) TaxID=1871050 RepID=UPI00273337DA|nr:DUF1236 domain-containing protein [Bosea sp. (in: a-proteobacteria)]MDP3409000.1 DUF1236 domain-containing protein [Bosea sp. (in: a-proteobacteria)]